ncbi:hypothetical protein [Flavobacterium crassostreae]|uniref:hypothetical protein n=1 Tax=Flavobacterium crassostreae TaxID=1763534 RepID=UPI0012FD7F87|nr:hypothetical protein [Flavobacterium crassostreae]
MKKINIISGVGKFLQIAVKYGAYFILLMEILEFAKERFETLQEKQTPKIETNE